MLRGSFSRSLQASRAASSIQRGRGSRRALATGETANCDNRPGDTNRGVISLGLVAALGAVGIAYSREYTSSPSTAYAENAADNPNTGDGGDRGGKSSVHITPPIFSTEPQISATAAGNVSPVVARRDTPRPSNGNSSEGPAGNGPAGIPAGAGDKLGLRESTDVVRARLKEFRTKRAAQGVPCPAIDFRQEPDQSTTAQGATTLSASFYLPRSANMLKILSTMVSADQVLEVQPMLGKPGAAIGFCDKDRTGSLLVRQGPTGTHGSGGSVHVYRDGGFTKEDINNLVKGYVEAWSGSRGQDDFYRFVIAPAEGAPAGRGSSAPARHGPGAAAPIDKVAAGTERLRQLGVEVHDKSTKDAPGWDTLAGYADVKQEIEDTLVMPLRHPEMFDNIARKTRARFESNRPRAILFEGPPGTGKTLSARVIAGRSDQPMVHVPVEGVMSKWYGESEKKLSAIFEACDEMGGAIIFIDEVDALAGSRDNGDMHEATRRILSVILQKVEGFEGGTKSTLICATNRKSDLDTALLSRFQLTIRFGLPDAATRREVFGAYAKQLSSEDLKKLAAVSNGMSCRDIKETCQHAERRWASKLVRGQETRELPPLEEYVHCLEKRSKEGVWRSRPAQA